MATNIEEALSGGSLSVSAKPVTMEALPEATIDVGGGSQSLAIEGLGVKRKKDDLSVTTSSTSQIAIQDLFGDLLDEVNFSDPSSVDAFRSSAQTRIDEMDLDSVNRVLGTASSVASDISTLASPFLDRDSSQNQFQQVFGPPAPTSVTDSGGSGDVSTGSASGFDTEGIGSSRDFADLSALGDPSFAASAFGGAFNALGPGGSLGSFATGQLGSIGSLSSAAQAFGGFQGLQNADISNPAGALAAVTSGLNAAKGVSGLLSQAKNIPDIFSDVEKTISKFAQNAYNTLTNPALAMEAYGRNIAYGTQFPDLYSFETNQGLATFAFDAKTGAIATPGFLAMMLPGPLKAAFSLSQQAMKELGYSAQMQARNAAAIEAYTAPEFETPNTSVSVYSSPNATVSFDATTGDTSISGAFASIDLGQEGYGQVGFDLGALSEAMGPDGTVGSISYEGFQDSAITGTLGHGPLGFDAYNEEEALAADIAGQLSAAGLGTKADIADYADRSASLSSLFGEAFGLEMGMDFSSKGIESLAADPLGGMDKQLSNAPPAASGLDFGIAKAAREDPAMAALYSMYTTAYVDMVKAEPLSEMANELGMAGSIHSMAKEAEGKQTLAMIRSQIQAQQAARGRAYGRTLGGDTGEGYNSQSPSFDAVSMADYAMGITGKNTFDTVNDVTDQAIADHVSGIMGAFGFASVHATTEAINNEPLSGMDAGLSSAAGRDPGGEEEAGYDIGFSAAAQDASAAMAALGGYGQRSDPTSDLGEMPGYHSPEFDPFGGDSQVSGGFGAPDAPGAPDAGYEGLGYGYGYGEEDSGDCFVQGTLVLMAEGSTKAIEKVVVGDLVAGKDGNANTVKATHIKKPDIPFLYGFNGHKPFVTAYHPFMTKEGWGCFEPEKFKEHRPTAYQEIANEQGGKDLIKIKNNCEILRSDNEWVLVEDIVVEGCDPNLTVYNLSVANDKTFVANNYIVHNKGGGGDDGSYICTAAYANGVTDYSTFSANRKYGINLRRNDPYLMKGYDLVGPTLANMLGGTKVAKVLTNYYKMDLDKKVVSFRYKLLQIFLKGVMRPTVRTIGYLNERIFK